MQGHFRAAGLSAAQATAGLGQGLANHKHKYLLDISRFAPSRRVLSIFYLRLVSVTLFVRPPNLLSGPRYALPCEKLIGWLARPSAVDS
eukprot:scaffold15902_cov106-Isochrysis_galbana.AAC.5